ncbi:MAG: DNA polymerase I, partial [Firmicutes bacterium]|nr:DNA polymerase I [Bacillota bacterium]
MNNKRLVIIDGNSLIFRAYYAIQRPMITKSGQYTHGIYGFLNMLSKIQKEYEPGYIAVTFDLAAPTFRHKEYAEYKATRKKMPPELAMQMEPMKEILRAMNIKILQMEGFEGDDIIGTLARRGEKEGLEPLIITGDRDALQLATDTTKILITKKGISEFELFDADHMQEVYGMTPAQVIDYKALRGDTSDNIPGLPGVGEKTAQKLIADFENVDNLLENIDKIQPAKLQEKVRDNKELV